MEKTLKDIEKEAEHYLLENVKIPEEYLAGAKEFLTKMMYHEAYDNPK